MMGRLFARSRAKEPEESSVEIIKNATKNFQHADIRYDTMHLEEVIEEHMDPR